MPVACFHRVVASANMPAHQRTYHPAVRQHRRVCAKCTAGGELLCITVCHFSICFNPTAFSARMRPPPCQKRLLASSGSDRPLLFPARPDPAVRQDRGIGRCRALIKPHQPAAPPGARPPALYKNAATLYARCTDADVYRCTPTPAAGRCVYVYARQQKKIGLYRTMATP